MLVIWGFPDGTSGKEPTCQCKRCKRHEFDPWVGQIPLKRARQAMPVSLPRESPRTEEPGRLQSIGSQRVRHDWHDHTCTHISGYVWVVGLGWVLFFLMFFSTLYFCKQTVLLLLSLSGLSVMAVLYPVGEVKSTDCLGGCCISHYLPCN